MRTAIFAGSFDPIHNGHLDIIRRAAKMYDEFTVAVTVNFSKKSLLTPEERSALIEELTADMPNVKVVRIDGLRADYVNAHSFTADVRSLRNTADFNYEMPIAQGSAYLYNNTETVFLFTDPKWSFLSSTMIKEVASLGGDISEWVPANVLDKVTKKYEK